MKMPKVQWQEDAPTYPHDDQQEVELRRQKVADQSNKPMKLR